jgi:RNA polymerase sigma-70 factor (ECF subfamily)
MSDSPTDKPDSQLLDQAGAGDRAAMAELLRRHGPVVRSRLAARISSVWQASLDADDVMQVTYLEAFLRITSFQPRSEASFVAWLSQIAENNLRDAIKELERLKRPNPRNRVQPAPAGEDSYVALVELLGATLTTPSIQAARGELKAALDDALAKLPPDYAQVIRLYDLEGLDATEVGRRMNRSQGAVYMLLARAHDRLRDFLGTESRFFTHG